MPRRTLSELARRGVPSGYWFHRHNSEYQTKLGFYHTLVVNKRWWIIDPQGQPWLSMGICHITYEGDEDPTGHRYYQEAVERRYGSREAWAAYQARRLRRWHFNTVGSWSSPELYNQGLAYTVMLFISGAGLGSEESNQLWLHGGFPDVFADSFREAALATARELCAPRVDDPNLLGYFSDNELDWNGWRRGKDMFDYFFDGHSAPAKQALIRQLQETYGGDVEACSAAWDVRLASFVALYDLTALEPGPGADLERVQADKDAYLRLVARTYFDVSAEAIRAADPNHMYLGVRFAGQAEPIVVEECGRQAEIITFNNYSYDPPEDTLSAIAELTLRPVMITEWSFKGMDAGLPNTKGAAIPVYTQDDRADGYERYVTKALELPYVVGLHWFQFSDQPVLGRYLDGENSNYGVVTQEDEPWITLVNRMTQVNGRAVEIAKTAQF